MNSTEAAGLDAFFESYRDAFRRFDAEALAEAFVYPCHITHDANEVAMSAFATKADYVAAIEQFLRLYRKAGVSGGAIVTLLVRELTPRLVQANLRWRVDGHTGPLYEFDATYTLVSIDGAWRIAALAHAEFPKLAACLEGARRERDERPAFR